MCALESGSKRDMIDKELSAEECHSNHREIYIFQTYIMDEASTAHTYVLIIFQKYHFHAVLTIVKKYNMEESVERDNSEYYSL